MNITIQISEYNWVTMEEEVYEAEISSIEDLIKLSYRFDKKVQYKKPTDKSWYYSKTMIKRLFRKELSEKYPDVKFVGANDLNTIMEKRHLIKLKRMKKDKELAEAYEEDKKSRK